MRSLFVLVLLAVVGSVASAASCHDSVGNLLAASNCGFDKDAKGWTAAAGAKLSHDADDNGVLKATADAGGSLTITGPCVPAQSTTEYHFAARLRGAAGTAYFCGVNFFQYSDAQCTQGEEPLGSASGPPRPAWAAVEGSATTSGATKSIRVRPACSGEPAFVVQFDDFVLAKR